MATLNYPGTISRIDSGRTTGAVKNDGDPAIYEYSDVAHPFPAGANVPDAVTFDLDKDARDKIASNVALANGAPPDEGQVREGETINDNLTIDGTTVTLKGSKINGNLDVKNSGKVILKSSESGVQSDVGGNLGSQSGGQVVVFTSKINGNLDVKNSNLLKVTNGKINGNLDVKNSQAITVDAASIGGNLNAKDNVNVLVKDSIIAGNLTLNNNAVCAQSGNTVGGNNSGCN